MTIPPNSGKILNKTEKLRKARGIIYGPFYFAMNLFEIKKKIRELWPKLKDIWLWDKKYYLLTFNQLEQYSEIARKAKIVFPDGTEVVFGELINSGDYWDCDNFSVGADFLVKLWGKIEAERNKIPKLPLVYGKAMGSRFNDKKETHALNWALTNDDLYFNDHDSGGKVWRCNPKTDIIFFLSV